MERHDTKKKKSHKKRGRRPEHLRIDGDWKEAVQRAIKKEKPKDGWPDEHEKTSEK